MSSAIWQVERPEPGTKSNVPRPQYASIAPSAKNNVVTQVQKPAETKRPGFFARLLCCITGRSSSSSSSSSNSSSNVAANSSPSLASPGSAHQLTRESSQSGYGRASEDPSRKQAQIDQSLASSTPRFIYPLNIPGGPLMPPQLNIDTGRKTLVLDLDETLVHSSFKPVPHSDFIIPVEIEGTVHQVYVRKRPHVDLFLQRMGEVYEVVVFTASLSKYADPVMDLLDKSRVVRCRLFREHCAFHMGNYVKDLSKLGRKLSQSIIIDNSPASYLFQPQNAVPVTSWFDDEKDTELYDMIPFLEELAKMDNVYAGLRPSGIA